jgi:3'-phosphoadenosine 5'-phosphosulfate (PAPS) 3'-phosphatase
MFKPRQSFSGRVLARTAGGQATAADESSPLEYPKEQESVHENWRRGDIGTWT